MSCGDVQQADWQVEPGTLPTFLAHWAERGYTPRPAQPQAVLIDGVAYHRYRMVHVGA